IKGPFFKIGRDHQDGVGTCFANTAKNLLVGLSEGKDDASFLDMALQYQSLNGNRPWEIDGGGACPTLTAISSVGYCPKSFSPIESGDLSQTASGFFGQPSTSLYEQSSILNSLKNYLKGKALLEGNSDD